MEARRRTAWLALVLVGIELLFFTPSSLADVPPSIVNVTLSANPTPLRGKLEISFEVANAVFSNPFDPAIANVQATFIEPSPSTQHWATPCFWFQDYSRSGNTKSESTTPVGSPLWSVMTRMKLYGYANEFLKQEMPFYSLCGWVLVLRYQCCRECLCLNIWLFHSQRYCRRSRFCSSVKQR